MNRNSQLTLPPAPNLIAAIRLGFDAIANHILLILFPIALDIFLWIGPRLRLTELIRSISDQLFRVYTLQDPGMIDFISPIQEAWAEIASQFNLLAALRSYPVGVTSLIVSQMPKETPVGLPLSYEISSFGGAFIAWVFISVLGIALGTLYFTVVAQAATSGEVSWRQAFILWPWASLQMFYLALLLALIIIFVSIPGSFILSMVALGGISFGQCIVFIYIGFIIWLFLPLVFSPHGIVLNRNNILKSIKVSVGLLRKTLPTTLLFILAIFLLSKGLDILWLVPRETSWLLLIGILGHAFITTSLLASSFVYYRDGLNWIQEMVRVRNVTAI
jgi:hypothetical protein